MGSVMYLSTVGMSDSWECLDVVVPLCMMLPTGLFVMTEPFKDTIYHSYQDILKHVDPRVEDLPLMSSPLPTIALCLAFVVLVKIVGPWYMSDKPAMKFNNVLIGYNFLQVLLSAKIFYEVGISGWLGRYDFRCQPVDYSSNPVAMRMLQACYLFYISKFVDFLATFFFVLHKKDDQISALHVIHHGIIPISTWVGMKFTAGGHYTFFVLLSSFVHVWMHLYYMIDAMGPQYERFIWWKKYLPELQIVQFMAIVMHSFQLCFRECDFPIAFVCWIGGHAVLVLGLFLDKNAKAWFDDIDYDLDDEDIQNLMFGVWNQKKTDENGNIIEESEDAYEHMSSTDIYDMIDSNTSEQRRRFVNFSKKLMVRLLH